MASFDENGKYIKTNWKAGDKITATKLNKIEESIEAVNDNDISRHVEADARLDALEAKDVTHDKELTNIKNTIADNKAAAELGDYEINSRMTFLEEELNEGIEEVHNVAETVDGKIATAEDNMTNAINTAKDEMAAQVNTAKDNLTFQVNQGKADMEAMVAEVEVEMIELQNDVSEIQDDVSEIQDDMTNSHTQSFTVIDSYKFTLNHDGMMSSLVTLDNIMGSSEIKIDNLNERKIVTTKIKSICTVDVNSKNYFEDMIWIENSDGAGYTRDGNDITVFRSEIYQANPSAYAFISLDIPTLTEGKKYCLFCDAVIINDGASAVEIHSGDDAEYDTGQTLNSRSIEDSSFNKIFVYSANRFEFKLHCTVGSQTGNVTYKNVQIYEVKEIIVPDIQLNSLPNGVKDEIKDGVLIKRTGYIPLNTLSWQESSTNVDYPNSPFKVYIAPLDNLKLHVGDDKIILCNMLECKPQREHTASAADTGSTAISGSPERAEVRIKVSRTGAPDLTSLYTWLANDNVHIVYELAQPEYIDVSTAIKADKNDTIIVNTCKPLDFTYDIQCSTKSQIEETQKQISKTNKSIWQKLKNLTDGEMKLEQNGYIKLPTVLGGLILQWGVVLNDKLPNVNESSYILYNTHFTNFPYFISLTPDTVAGFDDRIYSTVDVKTKNFGIACNGGTKTSTLTTLRWFAIGK